MYHQQQPQKLAKGSRSRSNKQSRPKSAKTAGGSAFRSLKPPPANSSKGFQVYKPQAKKLAPTTAKTVTKKRKIRKGFVNNNAALFPIPNSQGVMMNNFFPALEGGMSHGADQEFPSGSKD